MNPNCIIKGYGKPEIHSETCFKKTKGGEGKVLIVIPRQSHRKTNFVCAHTNTHLHLLNTYI